MTQSPKFDYNTRRKILDPRADTDKEFQSKWNCKIHEPTGLTYPQLRFKVGEACYHLFDGRTQKDIALQYHVSEGFTSKWANYYKAYREANDEHQGSVSVETFKSMTNRPSKLRYAIPWDVRRFILETRMAYPFMGSRKIRVKVREELGKEVSCTGIDNILRAEGLIKPGRTRNNGYHGRFERGSSMTMVQIDYKSWPSGVKTLWILDDCSRCILGYIVSSAQSADDVIDLLESTFAFWGCYPQQILSDHGTEFYSMTGGPGASKLDKWCEERGIDHIMGRVRHPQTQGKIERSHATATREIERFGSMDDLEQAKETVSRWVDFYNNSRPHQALDDEYPMNAFIAKMPEVRFDRFLEGSDPLVVAIEEPVC